MAKDKALEYREPFFGGGSIGMALLQSHNKGRHIWINDLDKGISCLWGAVIQSPDELKERVKAFTPTPVDFYQFREELLSLSTNSAPVDTVDIGFKKIAIHQISYSGLGTKSGGPLGGKSQNSKYPIDCRWSPLSICKKIDKLHKLVTSVYPRYGNCSNFDFEEVITDSLMQSLIYLDPPYYNKGNDLYQHGLSENDHIRLAKLLADTKHQWLLSYDDCPEVRELYHWATIDEIDSVSYTITALKDKVTGDRISRTKKELLISPK